MSSVLELENVSFSFDWKKDVLSDISLRIDQGEMVGLVGGNGAGKSTLIWCALGLLHHRGTVRLFGQKRNAESSHRVGVVFQNPEDQLFMPSLLEDLTLPLLNRGIAREEAVAKADAALQQAGLAGLSNKSARQLSLGQRKRAAIAAALVFSPDLLILDEPTAELDGRSRGELAALLQSLPATMLIASHDLEFLAQTVERVMALENGKLLKSVAISSFIDDTALQERLYLR
jgi:cobalt/nickel transport system ATP-binding protein